MEIKNETNKQTEQQPNTGILPDMLNPLIGGTTVGKKKEMNLSTPSDFTAPEDLFKTLIQQIHKYHPSTDTTMIEKAYRVADEAHKGQKRKSGEP
jgi:hypothetical protein